MGVDLHVQDFHPADIGRDSIDVGLVTGLLITQVEHVTDVPLIQAAKVQGTAALGKLERCNTHHPTRGGPRLQQRAGRKVFCSSFIRREILHRHMQQAVLHQPHRFHILEWQELFFVFVDRTNKNIFFRFHAQLPACQAIVLEPLIAKLIQPPQWLHALGDDCLGLCNPHGISGQCIEHARWCVDHPARQLLLQDLGLVQIPGHFQ